MKNEKIEQIKKERIELLQMINNGLKQNRTNLSSSISNVVEVIKFDEENVKKYEAIKKAQEIVIELTHQIALAKDASDVVKLRNKLNYYINKIKKEIEKRNIPEENLTKLCDDTSYLRKDISKYIRYLKRTDNLTKIDEMKERYSSLTDEEKKELKRLIKNEISYNHRNMKVNKAPSSKVDLVLKKIDEEKETIVEQKNEEQETIIEKINDEKETIVEQKNEEQETIVEQKNVEQETIIEQKSFEEEKNELEKKGNVMEFKPILLSNFEKRKNDAKMFFIPSVNLNNKTCDENKLVFSIVNGRTKNEMPLVNRMEKEAPYTIVLNSQDSMNSVDALRRKALFYSAKYHVLKVHGYNGSFMHDLLNFIKNLPIYSHNKKKIQKMEHDYMVYYRGFTLGGYIEYSKKRNSISQGLKSIFNKSYLFSKEGQYLNNHEKCGKWMKEFFDCDTYGEYDTYHLSKTS